MKPEDFERIARRILDRVERDQTLHLSSITYEIRIGWLEWEDRDEVHKRQMVAAGPHRFINCYEKTASSQDAEPGDPEDPQWNLQEQAILIERALQPMTVNRIKSK